MRRVGPVRRVECDVCSSSVEETRIVWHCAQVVHRLLRRVRRHGGSHVQAGAGTPRDGGRLDRTALVSLSLHVTMHAGSFIVKNW